MRSMKRYLLFASLSLAFSHLFAQYQPGVPYQDAVRFLKDMNTDPDSNTNYNNKQELLKIVSFYFDANITTQAALNPQLALNPFLAPYGPVTVPTLPAIHSIPSQPSGGASQALLGMDVSNIADGIAKFLISRGKQELS